MNFGSHRPYRHGTNLWLFTLFLAVSCAEPAPASTPDPTLVPLQVNYQPTPTPFQPQPGTSPDPYLAISTPQDAVPTYTPVPTKYVPPQDVSVPVDVVPAAQSGVTLYNPLTGLPVSDPY
ncbi:MAG TPA: hypothetical protein PKE23_00675, partial [Anaerolineales bacterium]|nr:hypothetical protein [Anaerolineales bacterium]